mmetsp:Transcript_101872/g.287418  ORF Transcript_101872/g.287418 Transcript_101872/m.287418 type:complete len:210 (+) Transcript_101872:705-1334(+)
MALANSRSDAAAPFKSTTAAFGRGREREREREFLSTLPAGAACDSAAPPALTAAMRAEAAGRAAEGTGGAPGASFDPRRDGAPELICTSYVIGSSSKAGPGGKNETLSNGRIGRNCRCSNFWPLSQVPLEEVSCIMSTQPVPSTSCNINIAWAFDTWGCRSTMSQDSSRPTISRRFAVVTSNSSGGWRRAPGKTPRPQRLRVNFALASS